MTRLRILADVIIDGAHFAPDSLIDAPAELAAQLVAGSYADDHADAVAYCLAQGASPVAIGGIDAAAVDAESKPKTTRRKKA